LKNSLNISNPREAAFRVLKDTAAGHTPEDSLALRGLGLSPRDMNLAAALVYEVLRHQSYLDWLWRGRLTAGRAGPDLALVLRLGLAQILYFDRLGDHAVVSETVALAKSLVPGRHGLVNAVLRGLLRERDAGGPWPPSPPDGPDTAAGLALKHSCPAWLAADLLARLGPAEAEALLAAGNQPTPPTLRMNPRRTTREELALPFKVRPTALSPWGLRAETFAGRPETWPGFEEGLFALQDEASQLVGLLAGELPAGAGILDTCAGQGGKALHLAALNPAALVTARDRDQGKLDRLAAEARRLGLDNLRLESRDLLAGGEGEEFDLVLVDAPCSGLGVIRRRPDLKWSKGPEDVTRLAALQLRLLAAASGLVRPGGRLLYGVCTFSLAEGPETAAKFLAARPGFRAAPPTAWPPALRPHLVDGHLTLWPHRHQTDGFFWAMFLGP
jgi:16S rRNA (cytosine967-C5)-methyltransferase